MLGELPELIRWLESGSDGEQETAERIYEAFAAVLLPGDSADAPDEARALSCPWAGICIC